MAYMRDASGRRLDSFTVADEGDILGQVETVALEVANLGATQARPPVFYRANGGQPVFTVDTQNPVAGAASPTTSTSIYWPWVLDARILFGDSALDEFYMYYSTDHESTAHANSGIWLATGPTEMGPWQGRGRVWIDNAGGSQTETPSVFRDPTGAAKAIMLYQQEGVAGVNGVQTSKYVTSNDGLTWTAGGVAIDVPVWWPSNGHTGYARVRDQGQLVAHSLAGGADYPVFAVSRSTDGRTWWTDREPLTYQMDLVGDGRRVEWNSGDVILWNGQYWWVGSTSDFVSGLTPKDARLVIAPISSDFRSITARPTTILYPTQGAENTNYRAMRTFVGRDGALYLYYQCGNSFYVATTKEPAA